MKVYKERIAVSNVLAKKARKVKVHDVSKIKPESKRPSSKSIVESCEHNKCGRRNRIDIQG